MIDELANDYSNFMKVDLQNEFQDVQETIDDMLTRLDEFENLVNMVKADSELCADKFIPTVLRSKTKLDLLCLKIDSLEKFINFVKSDMETLESQVEMAEADMGQTSGKLKNIFKPLFLKKTQNEIPAKKYSRTPTYEVPTLFTTANFFQSHNENSEDKEQKT